MAALSIRNLDDIVHERLRVRAAENGRSMEAEVRSILVESLRDDEDDDLISAWMKLREAIGGVDLEIPARSSPLRPVDLS